jgi:PAS domain S-box-containing protein
VVANQRGVILRVNTAILRLFGYAADELVGSNLAKLCEPRIAKQHQGFIDRFLQTRRRVAIGTHGREVMGQHKNGTLLPLRLSVGVIEQQDQILFIGQLHDLHFIKAREEELRIFSQVNKTLVERTSAEIHERIMHIVAHELRNPLQAISGLISLIRPEIVQLGPDKMELLSEIDASVQRCCSVLDNAVKACNYETRRLTQDPAFQLTNVSAMLESVAEQMQQFTSVYIAVLVADDVPENIHTNSKHTQQVRHQKMLLP